MTDDTEALLQAWHTNNRINLFLIDRISAAGMRCSLSKRGGRNVAGQFASHHRGSILLTLKQSGHGLDIATQYAIWGL